MDSRATEVRLKRRVLLPVLIIVGVPACLVLGILLLPLLLRPTDLNMGLNSTKSTINGLETALELFALDHGNKLPVGKSPEALTKLIKTGKDEKGEQQRPYLERAPRDFWGNPLHYEYPSKRFPDGKRPAIWSNGLNGINEQGDGDDIGNWSE
jgi:general secretion pathway protein G